MTTIEKLTALRAHMKKHGADILLVTSDDYHQSEYVGDYFKSRAYISGFTGSAGTLVITENEAKLFTDGRYYIQAERQLEGSTIGLMRSGSEGVPTPTEYILTLMKEEKQSLKSLAFDGKCVSAAFVNELRKKLPEGASLITEIDFPALIWENRPQLPSAEIWALPEEYSGKSHKDKLSDVRTILAEKGCDALVMSSLCDIAWLYNLRGGDVENTPVFLSYCIVTADKDMLFANPSAYGAVQEYAAQEGITLLDYKDFYKHLDKLSGKVMVDETAVSEAIVAALSKCDVKNEKNPTLIMKAKKNETELKNLRLAHISDGLAMTKMMFELKFSDKIKDELEAEKRIHQLRIEAAEKVGVKFLGDSFGAICAFGPNAAMMHYSATPESYSIIDKQAPAPMLLIDSGGQYLEGTTDITRTFVLGKISDEIKTHYTLTACGMLRLANLKFLEGITGKALDIVCREPLWELGIDYRCGTGHGVGYLLSVHEGPNSIHWGRSEAKIEEGMVTTDEPGVYVGASHGIRIENELVCQKDEHNEYGQFMRFDTVTFCPIDLDGINPELLDKSDIIKLNNYHKLVYDILSPYLNENEKEKLSELTAEIH